MQTPAQLSLLSSALLIAMSATAQAQTPPNMGDVLQQVQPFAPDIDKPAPKLPEIGGVPEIEPPMQALPSGPTLLVKGFDLVGYREIPAEESLALLAGAENQSYSLAQLEELATRITRHYRSKGYFVARAYIPAQEVKDGIVTIRVVEANYGQFHLKNSSLVRDKTVQAMLDDVKKYDIVSLDTLERAMLIINDTPGVQVTRADVMPGEAVGTSDFAVETEATERHNGYILADNYGSIYTGKHRLSFNYDNNSPTASGDRLSISGLVTEGAGIWNGRLAYSTLLMPNGLRGQAAISHTEYELGDQYKALDAKGTASAIDVGLSYPIRRIRAQTIEGVLNVARKDITDRIDSTSTRTPKDMTTIMAGINLRDERPLMGYGGVTQASASLTYGDLSINDATARANDKGNATNPGANTQGQFAKVNLSASRVNLLPYNFSLSSQMRLQHALNGKNLDGSERMSVTGMSGVYAYPNGELSGSNAGLVKVELSRPLPNWFGLQNQWSTFATGAYAESARSIGATDKGRALGEVGLGWRAQYKGLLLNTHLAYRLDGDRPISEKADRARFLLQAGWVF